MKLKLVRTIAAPVAAALVLIAATALAAAQGDAPRFVIGGQFAFDGEGDYVIEQMQHEGGRYFTLELPTGRTAHVLDFAAYPGVRLVYMGTRMGMENATQASVLMATLPEEYRPDVVIHSGISGNAGDGSIGDIYLNSYFVLANYGTQGALMFEPEPVETWDPSLGVVVERQYFPTDQRLIELGVAAFERYQEDPQMKEIKAQIRPEGEPLLLLTKYVGASSNWFVASSEVVDRWQLLYGVRVPENSIDFPGEVLYREIQTTMPLGTIDMESAAAAKTFFEFGIPFAAARYPSDSARELAEAQVDAYWVHAARIGGGFVWEWIRTIAAYASDPSNPLW